MDDDDDDDDGDDNDDDDDGLGLFRWSYLTFESLFDDPRLTRMTGPDQEPSMC